MNCFSRTVRNWTEPKRKTGMKMSMTARQEKFRVIFMYLGVGRLPIKSRSKILMNTRIRKIIFLGPFVTQSRSKILMNGRIRKCVKSFINKVEFYSHRIALGWDSCSSGWRRVFLLRRILLCIFQTSTAT